MSEAAITESGDVLPGGMKGVVTDFSVCKRSCKAFAKRVDHRVPATVDQAPLSSIHAFYTLC